METMSSRIILTLCLSFISVALIEGQQNQALIPPSFNIAQGKKITGTSTCGDQGKDELYCKLTGNTGDSFFRTTEKDIVVNGQYCDYCDMTDPLSRHPVEYAIDGTEKWWQSPPLSRGPSYNKVNVTIDLGQSYHVAYVLLKFANSPRPGVWILEKSTDFGNTYEPWQYFADSDSDCIKAFGMESSAELTADDQVICTTAYSEIVPLEDGEIVVSLINGRPGSNNFYASDELQDFTRATNVRIRLLQTNTLLGHLMAKQQQDPTVTRRYYYSIKDISIGGRCLCNGHADRCDTPVPGQPGRIMCTCSHNTCGFECEECCPGFVQKKWLPATLQTANECEPCNCFGHATSCYYDEDIDHRGESIDIHGNYSGGGVCIDCQDNTAGVNCNECKPGYYRVSNTDLTSPSICKRCGCVSHFYTGNCAPLTGLCECKSQFAGERCNKCNLGHFDYPHCRECRCNVNGTLNAECQAQGGQCPCKQNFRGLECSECAAHYYNFPYCLPCECSIYGELETVCHGDTGQCRCRHNFAGRACDECAEGFYGYSNCLTCNCSPDGTEGGVCDVTQGRCTCKDTFAGEFCDRCDSVHFDFPNCNPCNCNGIGTGGILQCYSNGHCQCLPNFSGMKCDSCAQGFYRYPECIECGCDHQGSVHPNCDQVTGQCRCFRNYIGRDCTQCALGFYNFPSCEECNCAPSGVQEQLQGQPLGGCGAQTNGACICKYHVTGRSCDECKELYWNLQLTNPNGCEDCMCYTPGTTSSSQVCQTETGQCRCKSLVTGRQCTECEDGSHALTGSNIFGCSACDCDVGGAINNMCDKSTGQCVCRPRITGQKCDVPERAHFFHDLYKFRFEIEEGRSAGGGRVRIGYDESVFSNFSYLGYAIMSESTQPSVIVPIDVVDHVLYRIILCYVHTGTDIIRGSIKLTPSDPSIGSEQVHPVILLPGAGPQLVTVEGGNIISPFVLNPGRWFATIDATGGVLLDYLVLLPSVYYEASRLKLQVTEPCRAGQQQHLCNFFVYPNVEQYDVVLGQAGYYYTANGTREPTHLFTNYTILLDLGVPEMAFVDPEQPMLSLSFPISVTGEYILIVEYYGGGTGMSANTIEVITEQGHDEGFVATYACEYLCRSVVMDMANRVMVFVLPEEVFEIKFTQHHWLSFVAVSSVIAVPVEKWNFDLVTPTLQCVRDSNKNCLPSSYPDVASSIKVDVEDDVGIDSPLPPNIHDTDVKLYYMNTDLGTTKLLLEDIELTDGQWMVLVHYYQPHKSAFTADFDIVDDTQSGTFEAKYCPHVVGCRALVTTSDGSDTFNLLGGTFDFKISLQTTDTSDIWIDYVLAVPKDVYTKELLILAKQDRATDFIRECSHQEFYISPSTTGFCRDSVFSLSSLYNNGAEQCQCNIYGSLDYFCNQLGGQCQCRERYTGRQCDRCKIGFFDFPNCQDCRCLSGVCNDLTGVCVCPPNVIGDSCDACQENYFGYDPIAGCIECDCDARGTDGDISKCDRVSGQCNCKPNVGGRRCDQCLPGFHSYPFCHVCNCQLPGTVERVCDEVTADCLCKENVVGEFCDECDVSSFHLQERNPKGCTSCFCFGVTNYCVASNSLYRQQVNSMTGWNVTNVMNSDVVHRDNEVFLYVRGTGDNPLSTIYWIAPAEYLGNKITSYGGQLRYIVFYRATTLTPSNSIRRPDVILSGRSLEITYSSIYEPNPEGQEVALDILEGNFRYTLGGGQVTREDLMMVLADLRMLQIRAQYHTFTQYSSIRNVSLDIATGQGTKKVLTVEECYCPVGYIGLSCQECADGYHRSGVGSFLGSCIPCECNGHSNQCDKETGECFNCQHNTGGPSCGSCRSGYYEDSNQNNSLACQLCACPHAVEGNSFASSCSVSGGRVTMCNCLPGYYGISCSECEYDHYGSPAEIGGSCEKCFCNGNTDTNRVGRFCHHTTGECFCDEGFSGFYCERCADGYYGDAVNQHSCQECACNTCGVSQCDNSTGTCICKSNVVGDNCSRCRSGTWGFSSCEGCQSCGCGVASVTPECDMDTGVCACLPGVGGDKCDQCLRGFWDYGPAGCIECSCPDLLECEPTTGDCLCPQGATGEDCDTCEKRYTLTQYGCVACDRCVHQLLDEMDEMLLDINMTIPADVPLGQADIDRLDRLNDTLWNELKPEVAGVKVNNTLLQIKVAGMEIELEEVMEKADELEVQAVIKQDEAGNERLPAALNVKQRAINLEKSINQSYANLHGMIENSTNRNISEEQDGLQDSMKEARRIVGEIESKNFTAAEKASRKEQVDADILLKSVTYFNQDVDVFLAYVMGMSSELDLVADNIGDLIGWSNDANYSAFNAGQLNAENGIFNEKIQFAIQKSNALFSDGTNKINSARELLALARTYLADAFTSNANLTRDYTRLLEGIKRLEPLVVTFGETLEGTEELVDKAEEHAWNLTAYAAILVELSKTGVEYAELADQAAKAYSDIIDAIANAEQSAIDSKAAAEIAKQQSNDLMAEKILAKSKKLLNSAKTAKDMLDEELRPRMANSKKVVEELQNVTSQLDNQLKMLKEEIGNLPKVDSEEAIEAFVVATEAKQLADEVKISISDVETEIALSGTLLVDIQKDVNYSMDALDEAEDRIENVVNYKSSIETMTPQVTEKANLIDAARANMSLDINMIKQMVQEARGAAYRIRVGMDFLNSTAYSKMRPFSDMAKPVSYSSFSFYMKDSSDGLLFFIGGPTKQDDFMAAEVENSKLKVTYRLASSDNPTVAKSDFEIPKEKWSEVSIKRIGNVIKGVWDDIATFDVTSESTASILNIANDGVFYIGGVPASYVGLPDTLARKSFQGALHNFIHDHKYIPLWDFADSSDITTTHGKPVRKGEKDNVREATFNGKTYVQYKNIKFTTKSLNVILHFKSLSLNGLLLYVGNENIFCAVSLRNGNIVMQFANGPTDVIEVESALKYNDGSYRKVKASLTNGKAKLEVGNEAEIIKLYVVSEEKASLPYFIGGVRSSGDVSHPGVTTKGFIGCIRGILFKGVTVSFKTDVVAYEELIIGCKFMPIYQMSFLKPGYVKMPLPLGLPEMLQEFSLMLSFRTINTTGTLVTMVYNEIIRLTAKIVDSELVVEGVLDSDRRTANHKVSDGYWHVISLVKTPKKLDLLLDDVRFASVEKVSDWPIAVDSDIIIGGYANSEPFIGCISDLIINNKVQQFNNRADDENAEFSVCALDSTLGASGAIQPGNIVQPLETTTFIAATTAATSTLAQESCALLPPGSDGTTDGGIKFGDEEDSRIELDDVKVFKNGLSRSGSVKMSIKTVSETGLLYYAASQKKDKDFLTVYLANGMVVFTFDCGSGPIIINNPSYINDGNWHQIEAYRRGMNGNLTVDNTWTTGRNGTAKDINRINAPQYIGGLAQPISDDHVPVASQIGFVGCIKDFSIIADDTAESVATQNPMEFSVAPCRTEQGVFIQDGYVILDERVNIGKMFKVEFKMKPRVTEGVLMSVRTGDYFFVVEMLGGDVFARASNGEEPFETSTGLLGTSLCDGKWHNVTVEKKRSMIELTVDGVLTADKFQEATVKSAPTNDAFYIGGVPDTALALVDHITSTKQFVGCLKEIKIKDVAMTAAGKESAGKVTLDSCPLD